MNADLIITWALQTGLSVAVLVGLILLIRRPFAKSFGAKAAYALWALPLLRLFTPSIELAWLRSETELGAALEWTETALTPEMLAALQQASVAPSAEPSMWTAYSSAFIIAFWLAGAVIFSAWQMGRQRRTIGIWLKHAQPASTQLYAISDKIAADLQLKRTPKLYLSPAVSGPLVTGALRPKVILPVSFETDFTRQEQSYTLLHELAHIRRGDLYASTAALVVRALNWPNPLLHIAARYFRADQEAACDATVLAHIPAQNDLSSHSHDYAQTLMKAALKAQARIAPRMPAPALALTIHHPLKERLMTLSNPAPRQKLKHRLAASTIAALVLAVNAPISLVPASAQAQTELAGANPTPPTPPTTPSLENRRQSIVYGGQKQTHVVQSVTTKNGVKQERKVEIQVDGDEVRAFEIDPKSGTKTEINPETIDGYANITKGSGRFKIDNENGQTVRFEQSDSANAQRILEKLKESGKLDGKAHAKVLKIIKAGEDGDSSVWIDGGSDSTKIVTGSFSFDTDDVNFPDGLDISDFTNDEGVNVKVLKFLDGDVDFDVEKDVQVFFSDDDFPTLSAKTRLQAAESMLESAEKMLGETEDVSREMKKAQKELAEAMKALEKARAKLEAEK